MIISKLFNIVINTGAGLGLFFGIMMLTNKNMRSNPANKILSILLIVLSTSIMHSLLASPSFQSPYKIREPFILLIGPLLSFYIYELTGIRKHTMKDFIHGIPFVVMIIFLLPEWTSPTSGYAFMLHENALVVSKGVWALIVLQFGYYWWSIIATLRKHRTAVESEFSNLEGKTLTWMHFFLNVFGVFLLLLVLTVVIAFHTDYYDYIDTIVCFGLSCAIFALGHNGLFQKQILAPEITQSLRTAPESPEKKDLSRPDILSPAKNDELLRKLRHHLETSKPYLNETLTLTELATQIGATRNQLSYLINNTYDANFYSFINQFRVEEFKRLVAEPRNANFTILSLAYEAGFPSKSSFHTIFKKVTGQTPAEYRSKIQ